MSTTPINSEVTTAQAIVHLRAQGYMVEKIKAWENINSLCRRLGIERKRFNRSLVLLDCPPVELERTSTGRIVAIASNAAFDAFVSRPRYFNRKSK